MKVVATIETTDTVAQTVASIISKSKLTPVHSAGIVRLPTIVYGPEFVEFAELNL